MKFRPRSAAYFALSLCCASAAIAQISFKPPGLISATDVQYPIHSVATGILVVDVTLDSRGTMQNLDVVRDVPSLTGIATSAVHAWKYAPALLGDRPVPSELRIAFVFRPHGIVAGPPALDPIHSFGESSPPDHKESSYGPPGIVSALYPEFPIDAASVGAVIVQVGIGPDGRIQGLTPIRSFQPFTQVALDAARKWQFEPAMFQGKPVSSHVVLVFVFSTLLTRNR